MKRNLLKLVALLLVAILAVIMPVGCSQKETPATESTETQPQTQPQTSTGDQSAKEDVKEADEAEELTLPIVKEPLTLTFFAALGDKVAATCKDHNEILAFQELEKRTGIKIEWMHPPVGQAGEQLNLILASQDLPDMIRGASNPERLIEDNIVLVLDELIDKYAPNFKKVIESDLEAKKLARTNDGNIWVFPLIYGGWRTGEYPSNWLGPQIRKDWLDRLGLEIPTTIDEWYNVLKAFKEEDANGNGDPNDEIPLIATGFTSGAMGLQNWATAWGVLKDFYNDNGVVKFGAIEDAFKDYLTTMAAWYKEGLIDPDCPATDSKNFDAKVTSGQAGAFITGDTRWATYTNAASDIAGFKLVGAPWPKGPTGKGYTSNTDVKRAGSSGGGTIITTKNQHPVESVKWLDYQYSPEGIELMNWGVEGVSFEKEGDKYKYTDAILNPSEDLTPELALAKHTMVPLHGWSTVQDGLAKKALKTMPGNLELYDLWGEASPDLILPYFTLTAEEESRNASLMSEINTYVDEMITKFIMGQESLENFDKFVETVKKMGIEEAINIQQTALDRANQE